MNGRPTRAPLVAPKLLPKKRTPTLADAVDQYLSERVNELKPSGYRSLHSFMKGSDRSRNGGRKRVGTPLAQSFARDTRVGELPREDWARLFRERCPEGKMANNTLSRNAKFFNSFLEFLFVKGYVAAEVLGIRRSYRPDESRPYWLDPGQLGAVYRFLAALIAITDLYDAMRAFAFETLGCTGARPSEMVVMQPRHLDPRTRILTIPAGKGRGAGKQRSFEVDAVYAERWWEHVRRHGLRLDDYMFYRREFRSNGGTEQRQGEWVTVSKREPMATGALWQFFCTLREDIQRGAENGSFPADKLPLWIADFSPQDMRKTYACIQLILHRLGKGGLTVEQLQRNLGHEDPRITRGYLPDVERYLDRATQPVHTFDAAGEIEEMLG